MIHTKSGASKVLLAEGLPACRDDCRAYARLWKIKSDVYFHALFRISCSTAMILRMNPRTGFAL